MPAQKSIKAQQIFFEKVKGNLPSNISFIDDLADVLEIAPTSVYRRIRGETLLTFDEILKICSHYNLTLDLASPGNASSVSFNYNIIPQRIDGMKYYLHSILDDLKMLTTVDKKKIIYVAEDIPIFHLFAYPELAAFKMYYWMKSVLNVSEYQNKRYSFEMTDKEILEIGAELLKVYTGVDSTEIWTEYTVNSLRLQIEYYWEAGLFKDENDAELLCRQANDLILRISKMAERGSKSENSKNQNYNLYYSEIEIGNNSIYVEANNLKKVYLTYNTFNKMNTMDEKFCDETYAWMNTIINKSNLISAASEKQRLQFVNKTLSQIDLTLRKVSKVSS